MTVSHRLCPHLSQYLPEFAPGHPHLLSQQWHVEYPHALNCQLPLCVASKRQIPSLQEAYTIGFALSALFLYLTVKYLGL